MADSNSQQPLPPSNWTKEKLSFTLTLIRSPPSTTTSHQSTITRSTATPPPNLIIVAAWMGAQETHISKYVQGHQSLFPSTPILLIECPLRNIISPSAGRVSVLPAVPVVLKHTTAYTTSPSTSTSTSSSSAPVSGIQHPAHPHQKQPPELLIHVFSNGGSTMTTHLLDAVRAQAPSHSFPLYAIVFDSCPGGFSWGHAYTAMAAGLPRSPAARMLVWPLLQGIIFTYFLRYFVWGRVWAAVRRFAGRGRSGSGKGRKSNSDNNKKNDDDVPSQAQGEDDHQIQGPDPLTMAANAHNTPLRRAAEVGGRTYIYGPADGAVGWRDIERHAAAAKAAGFEDIINEKFEGTRHVAHMQKDQARYWEIVGRRWDRWWERRRLQGGKRERLGRV